MNSLSGKTVVLTGRISVTRNRAHEIIVELGGYPSGHVSKSTDLVIVGEKPGSKLTMAGMYDVPTIDEDEFWEIVEASRQAASKPEEPKVLEPESTPAGVPEKLIRRDNRGKITYCPPYAEDMSYLNPEALRDTVEAYPGVQVVRQWGTNCLHCNSWIPYSTHVEYYYCFTCNIYVYPSHGNLEYHQCTMVSDEALPHDETGDWRVCTECGRFHWIVKLSEKSEFAFLADFVNSAEFAGPLRSEHAGITKLAAKTTEDSINNLVRKSKLTHDQLWRAFLEKTLNAL